MASRSLSFNLSNFLPITYLKLSFAFGDMKPDPIC
jgi:hypothetical protein